jgi:hypothetical protein
MDERWKDAIEMADKKALEECAKVVCEQTDCGDRGFDPSNCGKCAWCADIADSVVGTYLLRTKSHS